MTTIHDTARTVLALFDALEQVNPSKGAHAQDHTPSADLKALVAHLDARCPGLIQTVSTGIDDGERFHAVSIASPTGVRFDLYHVVPSCYEAAAPHDHEAPARAHHELVRLAADPASRQAIPVIEPGLTPHAVLLINDAAEAFAGALGPVPPQYSIGGVRDGKVHVTMAVDIDVASLNAFAGALGGAS